MYYDNLIIKYNNTLDEYGYVLINSDYDDDKIILNYVNAILDLMNDLINYQTKDPDVRRDINIMYNNLFILFKNIKESKNLSFGKGPVNGNNITDYLFEKIEDFTKSKINYTFPELVEEYENKISYLSRVIIDHNSGGDFCMYTFKIKLLKLVANLNYNSTKLASGDRVEILGNFGINIAKILVYLYKFQNDENSLY